MRRFRRDRYLQKLDMVLHIFGIKDIGELFQSPNALAYRQFILMHTQNAPMRSPLLCPFIS